MKNILSILLIFFSCVAVGFAQDGKSNPTPSLQQREQNGSEEDRVYFPSEVDTKAKIRDAAQNAPETISDCPNKGRVSLRVILRKSGKVTDVELIKGMGCGYDEKTVEAARKLKFSPAMKDGRAVSQYLRIEYQYERF